MLDARAAKQKTYDNITNCTTREFRDVMAQIEEAVGDGMFSICKEGSLSSIVIGRLRELGYEVKAGNQYNESYYSVRWD